MSWGLMIPIMIFAIPIFGMFFAAFDKWLKFKREQVKALNSQTAEKAARYAAQTEKLEQRVRVLERIITESKHDLAREIEDLRDPVN